MDPPELSDEQKALLDDTIRVVDAGPGSGKTRALVARFLASASASPRGVALVSFTNAAVQEVRRRAHHSPEVLRAPNFVGTIDSFLHRFIVTPAEASRLGRLPTYLASWDDLPDVLSHVRLKKPPGAGVPLSSFRTDPDGTVLLNEFALSWPEVAYLRSVDKAGVRQVLLDLAKKRINGLTDRGTYDSSAARVKAHDLLAAGETGPDILARISRRFNELLVDEAQDCDAAEIEVIRRIAGAGVTSLVVADPDQAIFEFRGSDPRLFLEYRDSCDAATRASLTTNYRSTPSICSAVTALRSAGVVEPNNSNDCSPVFVLSGTPDDQRAAFVAVLAAQGVAVDDAIVLAHRRSDASTVAGSSSAGGQSGAIGNRLAAALCTIHRSDNPMDRLKAVEAVEQIILNLLDWPDDLRTRSRGQQLDALGRRPEWLRQSVAAVLTRTSMAADAYAFGVIARDQLTATLDDLPIPRLAIPQQVKKPNASVWEASTAAPHAMAQTLRCDTVHGAKGMEFEAVLLALPAALRKTNGLDVLDEWEQGLNREPRRVLYVGASRARRILAFGAGPYADRVEAILRSRGAMVEAR